MSFLKMSSRVGSIKKFMDESANVDSIKYRAEVGTKHLIYFPYRTLLDGNGVPEKDESGNEIRELEAIRAAVHSWSTMSSTGETFHTAICTKGIVTTDEDGNILFDGSCPFCDRVGDAWDIYNYRKEIVERTCGKTGKELEDYIKNLKLAGENKAKKAENFMYVLVAKIDIDEKTNPVIGQDGIPSYSLKVMRLTESQLEKFKASAEGSGEGDEIAGKEALITYPANDNSDKRMALMQSSKDRTITVRVSAIAMTAKYPELLKRINEDVSKWEWEGIEKSFPEFVETSQANRLAIVNNLFKDWDEYKAKLETDPTAQYLEYNKVQPTNLPPITPINGVQMPSIGTSDAFADAPKLNTAIPQMGDLGGDIEI